MATFRAALSQLSELNVSGVRNNYDLHELPNSLHSAQLPALLVLPIELDSDRLFRERADSLQTAAFSGGAKTVYYTLTHLLLVAPSETGLGHSQSFAPASGFDRQLYGGPGGGCHLGGDASAPGAGRHRAWHLSLR